MKLKNLLDLIKEIQEKKNTSPVFICGGIPRDKVLNILDKIEDLDLTTGDHTISTIYNYVNAAFKRKYKIVSKERPGGHQTLELGNLKVDFSSNFKLPNIKEILHGMNVKNSTNLVEEMYSRDFNCNSLLLTLDLKSVLDPTNKGMIDIKNKIVDTILEPQLTLMGHKYTNRVVRSIYIASKLDFSISPRVVDFIKNKPEILLTVKAKTIEEKLSKSMFYDKDKTIYYINTMGLWRFLPKSEVMMNLFPGKL